MIMRIFCVRDRATDQYGNPMFLVSRGQAIRSFSDEINRAAADNQLYQHPEDFDLYELGSYNTDSGLFDTGVADMVCIGKNVSTKG
jgi:hypothetical protein